MISSHDEAMSLLSKWKADGTTIIVFMSDGPPDDPDTFFFSMTGRVRELSATWVEVAKGTHICRLRLDLPGTVFHYIESRDAGLHLAESDRDDAELLFEGCLSLDFDDGKFFVFNALREGPSNDEE
jgi:hypothetical protein